MYFRDKNDGPCFWLGVSRGCDIVPGTESQEPALVRATVAEQKGIIWNVTAFFRCVGLHSSAWMCSSTGPLISKNPLPITSKSPPYKINQGHINILHGRVHQHSESSQCIFLGRSLYSNFTLIFTSPPFIALLNADFQTSVQHLILSSEECTLP